MRRLIAVIVLCAAPWALAQTAQPAAKRPAAAARRQTAAAPAGTVSRATVESFLRHVFGFDKALKTTVQSIGPSDAPGVTLVKLQVETPQGKSEQSMFITPDRKHAILGAMQPFNGTPGAPPPKEAIDAYVRSQVGVNPGITWVVGEVKPNAVSNLTEVQVILTTVQGRGAQHFFVTADGKHALLGDVSPFAADPYAATREELARTANGPAKGPANAAVTLVEFGDLQCPACKAAAPVVERLLKEVPSTRLVFQQFPLVQIHKWAKKAAEFGDCIARENNASFWKFMDAVYEQQEKISDLGASTDQDVEAKVVPRLIDLATQAGANGKAIAACAAQPETAKHIDASMQLGMKMQVTQTPTLFINGRKISNVNGTPFEALKKITEFMGTPEAK